MFLRLLFYIVALVLVFYKYLCPSSVCVVATFLGTVLFPLLCLLSFGAESIVFQVAIQKLKDQDIENYNFARGFVWV
jgi:hypothetical protein